MEHPFQPKQLSVQAFKELKEITHSEFGTDMPDEEIEAMGLRLLNLFSIIGTKPLESLKVTISEQESLALAFIKSHIAQHGCAPSIRALTAALGFRSSRTGSKMMKALKAKGLM